MQAHHSIRALCRNLDVAPSGYHSWAGREPSDRDREDEVLSTHIRAIHKGSMINQSTKPDHAQYAPDP